MLSILTFALIYRVMREHRQLRWPFSVCGYSAWSLRAEKELILREETPPATWQRVQARAGDLLGAALYSTIVEGEFADC